MKYLNCERKPLRLTGYDYSKNGYYFITICTQDREDFFGEVRNGIMSLNEMGCVVAKCWQEIPKHFDYVKLNKWQIMPNHFHGVLGIQKTVIRYTVGDADLRPLHANHQPPHANHQPPHANHQPPHANHQPPRWYDEKTDRTKMLIPKIIHGFKSSVTRKINGMQNKIFFQWQRSYYDHIIRNKKSLKNIRNYIHNNPIKWELDVENQINELSEFEIINHYDDLFNL